MAQNSLPIPEGLDVIQEGDNAIIRRPWFSHTVWFLLLFCVVWDGFLFFWYSNALGHHKNGPMDLMAALFPIGHVAVGIGLTYFVICTFLNRTDLIFSTSRLSIQTSPLPWIGNQSLAPSEFTSFLFRWRASQNNNKPSYAVMYVTPSNREKTLMKGIPTEEQAEYITTVLSRFYFPDQSSDSAPAAG